MADLLVEHLRATQLVPWDELSRRAGEATLRPLDAAGWRALHEAYIARHDEPRGSARAAGMRAAVEALSTCLAPRGSWERLCALQAHVLGVPEPGFRRGPARARGGASAYGDHPDLEAAFRAKLDADAADGHHPLVTATRRVLDLAYFHPFEDGNARAMRLAWHDELAPAGIGLRDLEPLGRLPLVAGDPDLYREVFELALELARSPKS